MDGETRERRCGGLVDAERLRGVACGGDGAVSDVMPLLLRERVLDDHLRPADGKAGFLGVLECALALLRRGEHDEPIGERARVLVLDEVALARVVPLESGVEVALGELHREPCDEQRRRAARRGVALLARLRVDVFRR